MGTKQRTVRITDEGWRKVKGEAAFAGMTISERIEEMIWAPKETELTDDELSTEAKRITGLLESV